jgi:hypothetical protein
MSSDFFTRMLEHSKTCEAAFLPIPATNTFAMSERGWSALFQIEEQTFHKNYVNGLKMQYYKAGNQRLLTPEQLLARLPLVDPNGLDDGEEAT